uniref:Uncharacterized protein n=1 Tax=Siphoviridae sp. ctgu013 TaxID=2826421 RepID=A0A8S5NI29_9CAUD|nr:MAG TPA: hypothetical protein [Siphoviridae sp. ctgu013]
MGIVATMATMVKLREMLRMTVEPLPLLYSLITAVGLTLHLGKMVSRVVVAISTLTSHPLKQV